MKVLLVDSELDLEAYFADVSIGIIGSSNPPQGEMNLEWMGFYFYRLPERVLYCYSPDYPQQMNI